MEDEEQRSSRRIVVVLVATAALACALTIGLGLLEGGRRGDVALVMLLAPIAAAGRLFPIQIAYRRRMVTDTAPLFAAALLLSPFSAALVAGVAIAFAEVVTGRRTRIDPRQVIFNASQALLGVVAASLVFNGIARNPLPDSGASVMVGVAGAAATLLFLNDVLVFGIIWAQTGVRFRRMLVDFIQGRRDFPHDVALCAAGFVAAIAGSVQPWLIILLVVPLPVLYRAMRAQVALKLQTREACIAFADIVDARDAYTFGHCKRVAEFTREICKELGLPFDLSEEISLAARIHDLGKIGIRDNVLLKPARLERDEFSHMMEHPEIGARLTAFLPEFAEGTRCIRHHHEKWDGSGYPAGLKRDAIPLGARIIAVADTYDAITSTRVYRPGQPEEFARLEMARVAGIQLDPEVVHAWFRTRNWEWPESVLEPTEHSIVNETVKAA
ncbi:MAG: HD-GYP domain-containing protein [Dehalococcoidia bacterium]